MNIVFTRDGLRRLTVAWVILGVAIAAAGGIAWGSHVYLQIEKRDGITSKRQLSEALARVEAAKRERDDLQASSEIYDDLVKRGILLEESRLDLIERFERLKTRHQLIGLDYEISPQRPLPLAGGRIFNAVDVLGSRVKVRVQALHEGDALAFLDDLANPQRGFNPLSHCALRRIDAGAATTSAARIDADCTLEWITLKDKRGSRAK